MNKKKLFSDYLFNLTRMILNIGLPIITLPFVMNRIGPENYGVFSYSNSIISYFTLVAILGIPDYASRAIARLNDRESIKQTSSEIFAIQFISVSIALILFFAVFYPMAPLEYKPVFLILSIMIGACYFNTEWFFIGRQKFKYISLRSMIIKVMNVAAILLLIRNGDNSYKYALIIALTNLGNGIVNIIGTIPYLHFRNLDLKKHLRPIMILFGLSITGLINTNIDKTLTGALVGPLYVGYYAVGFRLTRVIQQVFNALNNIIFPRVTASLAFNKKEESDKLIRFSMDYIFLFSIPILLGLILYGNEIISLLFKPELLPAVNSLIILTGTVPVIAILNVIRRHILLSRDKDKVIFILAIITTGTNIIANLLLVPGYKHIGASIATLMAETAGMTYGILYIRNKFHIRLFYPGQLKYLSATPVLFIPWYLGNKYLDHNSITTLVIQVTSSVILYFLILFILKDDVFFRYTNRYGKKLLKK